MPFLSIYISVFFDIHARSRYNGNMRRFILPGVLALAFLLRVVGLSNFPVGFTPDEASFGYDAYSILKTGKDQWGRPFPLVLESFGDYKSPVYAYLTIPSVFLFDLNKFAVRFPNAILGTLAVFVTFLLAGEIGKLAGFEDRKRRLLQIVSSFLLAISSWHIMMGRGAFEANLTTFFLPLSVYLFLRGIRQVEYFFLSAIFFGINLFTYHSAKLVTPALFIGLIVLFRKNLAAIGLKKILPALSVALFFLSLTAYTFFLGAGTRVSDITIFKGSLERAARERIVATNTGMPDTLARLLHNKYQVTFRGFLTNYFQYFSFRFLFTDGPAETTYGMIPGRGVVYWFEILFIPGAFIALLNNDRRKGLLPLVLWLLLAPIPASLVTGPGYAANRAVIMLPALEIFLAFGGIYLFDYAKSVLTQRTLKYLLAAYSAIVVLLFVSFLEDYFIQSPSKAGSGMLYGNLEMGKWLVENASPKKIVVSRKLSEPQIFVAFASRWDPSSYQANTKNWNYKREGFGWVDMMSNYSLGNYIFRNIDWRIDSLRKDTYLVGRPEEFPEDTSFVKVIDYPDGKPAIVVAKNTQ